MAYCVHCGVRLESGRDRCPLCGVVSRDPLDKTAAQPLRAYPVRAPEQELRRSKRFLLLLSSLLLLGTAAVCLAVDCLLGGGITWSVYPAGALTLFFITAAVTVLCPRNKAYVSIFTAFLCLSGYLWLVERCSHSGVWFFPIVLPSLALGALLTLMLIHLFRKRILRLLSFIGSCFAAAALECLGVESFYSLARRSEVTFLWSPFVLAPCVLIFLVFLFIQGNRSVQEELRKRLFF